MKKILLIDNYDSFVHNLARYVNALNHETVVYRNDAITISDIEKINPSHIIISPGPCGPEQAGICTQVVQHFFNKLPILGVCLGHQVIAHAFGAKIIRAKKPMHGKFSLIKHHEKDLFEGLENPLKVGRYHSLVVDPRTLPQDLVITAKCDEEIMALQHKTWPVFGVQFHPESIMTSQGCAMLEKFIFGRSD